MTQIYGSHLTIIGAAKRANAEVTGVKLQITHIAVGDIDGDPLRTLTALRNEVWRGPVNSIDSDKNDPNIAVISFILPGSVGGFHVREIGYYDSAGDMVGIGRIAEAYQPEPGSGQENDQYIELRIIITDTANVTIQISPSAVTASREYVTDALEPLFYGLAVEAVNNTRDRLATRAENQAIQDALASSSGIALNTSLNGDDAVLNQITGSNFEYMKGSFNPVFFSATAYSNTTDASAGEVTIYPFMPLAEFKADSLRYARHSSSFGNVYAAIYDRNGVFMGGAQDNHDNVLASAHPAIEFPAVTMESNELYFIGFYHETGSLRTTSYGLGGLANNSEVVLPNVSMTPDYSEMFTGPNVHTSNEALILHGALGYGADMTAINLSGHNTGPIITLRNAN